MRNLFIVFVLLFTVAYSQAQVVVDDSQTVQTWVEDVLVGEGVDAFNVMVNGMPGDQVHVQVGGFGDVDGDIGIHDGIILGTGNIIMAQQANTGGSSSLPGADGYDFDPLEELIPDTVRDECIVEFDFIPQGDTLTFNYVFASEEYPEYVCGTVNDVFGFFLSGNNPDGGVYINENIALIPDPNDPDNYTDTPVSINTVNPGVVGTFGTNNNCDTLDPNWADYNVFYTPNTTNTYEYDGSTVVLTARAIVNCGEVYHITLGIGDGGDTAFDSAVFLEAGSFAAQPTGLNAQTAFPLGLVEISDNCDDGIGVISRPCAADTVFYQLNYLVNDSTAEYGVDYEALPTEMMMTIGQTDSVFPIITIADGIDESTEYICIELLESFDPLGPFIPLDTVCVAIIDNYTFSVVVDEQVMYCPEQVPEFTAVPQFPSVAPYEYTWTLQGTEVSTDNPYFPELPSNYGDSVYYTVDVQDYCGAVSIPENALVANLVPDYPTVEITATGEYCPGVGYALTAVNEGGTFPFSYEWTDELLNVYDDAETVFVDPQSLFIASPSVFKLVFKDNCNPTRSDTAFYSVVAPEPLEVDILSNNQICTDQELSLNINASGGYTPYSYEWTSFPPLFPPIEFPSPDGFLTSGADGEGVAFGFYVDPMSDNDNNYLLTLEINDWCSMQSDLFTSAIDIDTVQALNCIYPNVVSPNGDNMNDSFIINELINRPGSMFIYNRWGNLLEETTRHEWLVGDEADGTYYYVVQFEDGGKEKGYFTIVR